MTILSAKVEALSKSDEWPDTLIQPLRSLIDQIGAIEAEIERLDAEIEARHRACASGRRLASIPGIGSITASAIAATVPDVGVFRSSRRFAARLGPTPRANSSGGRERQAGITKQGDGCIRRLLVVGATAVIRSSRKAHALHGWLARLLERKKPKVAAVALANKIARIAWAAPSRNTTYHTSAR